MFPDWLTCNGAQNLLDLQSDGAYKTLNLVWNFKREVLIKRNQMADDSNFVALLNSLLSIDNDARTAAEVSVAMISLEKSIKLWIAREKCALRREKKKKLIRDDDESPSSLFCLVATRIRTLIYWDKRRCFNSKRFIARCEIDFSIFPANFHPPQASLKTISICSSRKLTTIWPPNWKWLSCFVPFRMLLFRKTAKSWPPFYCAAFSPQIFRISTQR